MSISTVFKEFTPRSRTYEHRIQGKKRNDQNQDKQTPHTVLQKLSPKMTHIPLIETLNQGDVCRRNRQFLKN